MGIAQSDNMVIQITDYSHENSAERHIFNLEIDIWRYGVMVRFLD